MPKILWENKYNIGDEIIDAQHQQLIEYFNAAHEHMLSNKDTSALGLDALIKMVDYCRYHFDSEEAYMKKIGYPDLNEHQKIHEVFQSKLEGLLLMEEEQYPLTSQILKIFENWIVDHILNLDKKIVQKNGG
mgnify:CR=1 FL=1